MVNKLIWIWIWEGSYAGARTIGKYGENLYIQSNQAKCYAQILLFDSLTSATVIDGKTVAKVIREEVKAEIHELVSGGRRPPCLCVVLVGDDPASHIYVNNKIKATKHVGKYLELFIQ